MGNWDKKGRGLGPKTSPGQALSFVTLVLPLTLPAYLSSDTLFPHLLLPLLQPPLTHSFLSLPSFILVSHFFLLSSPSPLALTLSLLPIIIYLTPGVYEA